MWVRKSFLCTGIWSLEEAEKIIVLEKDGRLQTDCE